MKLHIITLVSLFLPVVVLANDINETVGKLADLIKALIPIAFSAALLFFFYGLAIFILKAGGEDQAKGKSIMLWGVVALFIMSSIYGIIQFLGTSIGVDTNNSGQGFNVPTVKGQSNKGQSKPRIYYDFEADGT